MTTCSSRLLRASDFCRERTPRKSQVKVELLSSLPNVSKQTHVHDWEATVFVPVDLLVSLSLQVGDVAWLIAGSCSVPVFLLVDEQADANNGRPIVKVPPTIAASVGAHCENSESCWLQAQHENLVEASVVTVRPIGRPVTQKNDDLTLPWLSTKPRLLGRSSLISVWDRQRLFVFEVTSIKDQCQQTVDAAFAAPLKTQYSLEPLLPLESSVRRLPPLSLTASFHASLSSKECDDAESATNIREQCATATKLPPHPSIPQVRDALRLPASAPPAHRVLHVVGTEENHTQICIQSAADSLGLRYIRVRGLAAYAYASNLSVSTGSMADQLAGCRAALQQAQAHVPCVLHLADIDLEWSTEDEPLRHMQQQRLWTLLVDTLSKQESKSRPSSTAWTPSLIVVLSTIKPLSAGPLLYNLTFAPVTIRPPDETYAQYLWNDDASFENLYSSRLMGRSARDVSHLQRYWRHHSSEEALDDFCNLLDRKRRKAIPHIPTVQWQDVGGLAHVRSEIMDAIELPLRHPNLFPNSRGRSGILLYGPPGTGKTLIAKAVATECGLPFLSVKGPELLGSYVGESEANVRATFAAARQAAAQGRTTKASVLFFDELDSLAPRRGGLGDGGGVMERVVATLLTELDGPSEASMVFVIGATNRPDLLDPSLLRPGRLDRLVYLGMATKSDDRAQILAALIRKYKLEPEDPLMMARQVVDHLPPNLTGADFSAIASGALRKSLERVCREAEGELASQQGKEGHLTLDDVLDEWDEERLIPIVTCDDLIEASKEVVPSVSAKQLADYEQLRIQFSSS